MRSLFHTAATMLVVGVLTLVFGSTVLIASALGVRDRKGGVYHRLPVWWCKALLWAAGVKVYVHGREKVSDDASYIFTSNHVSLFDIPSLVSVLPRIFFVAKSELFKIPVFGPGIRAVGTIPIERTNQKAAFGSYTVASDRIRDGSSVAIFPEGTRGLDYSIRQFKKGPFVLAIQAGVPVVPVLIYGTKEVLPKKSLSLRPGRVDVYLLDPVSTEGCTYDNRAALAQQVQSRMADAMNTLYLNK